MTENGMSRREFIQASAKAAGCLAIGGAGLSMMSSCAAMQPLKQQGSVAYPRLAGKKIQSPEHYGLEGCYTGIWERGYYWAEYAISNYKRTIGKKPTFYFNEYKGQSTILEPIIPDVLTQMTLCAEQGVIPFVTYEAWSGSRKDKGILDRIIQGKYDSAVKTTARELHKFGREHGGFFIRMFREMNLNGDWSWAGNPTKLREAWVHVWSIFEAEGTNEYATWVFNPYAALRSGRDWQSYYPGDKYVDWIGLNGYAFRKLLVGEASTAFLLIIWLSHVRITQPNRLW